MVSAKSVFRFQSWSVNVGASTRFSIPVFGLYAWSSNKSVTSVVRLRETCLGNSPKLLFTKHF